jgi:hypothetical protein
VGETAGKAARRRKRYEALLTVERNERNAVELQLQEALVQMTKQQDADRLAEEVGRIAAEARSLTKRLAAKEQKFARDMALVQSQHNTKVMTMESEAQRKLEAALERANAGAQEFLLSVCKLFNSYIDVQLPVNFETVESLLIRVKADVEAEPDLKRTKILYDEIKRLVNVEQDRDAVRAVTDLVKFGEDMGQIRPLKQAIGELTIWIEKMFGLCCTVPSGSTDLAFMRKSIEQVLRRRAHIRETGADNPLSQSFADTVPNARYAFD